MTLAKVKEQDGVKLKIKKNTSCGNRTTTSTTTVSLANQRAWVDGRTQYSVRAGAMYTARTDDCWFPATLAYSVSLMEPYCCSTVSNSIAKPLLFKSQQ